ncbi:MAG: S8 family serine peptidase, partial [Thermodesulfobacteriota bacterium]|nr:S8 family serine peptidase [Thermodesulfobacteriota bacterium]
MGEPQYSGSFSPDQSTGGLLSLRIFYSILVAWSFFAFCVTAQSTAAVNLTPPKEPAVRPLIGRAYPNDADRNRLDDRIDLRIKRTETLIKSAMTVDERQKAEAGRSQVLSIELIFKEQITQEQMTDFLALGGKIDYIYKAVSYGWSGRLSLAEISLLPSRMGEALVLVEQARQMELHMRLATRTGRVRPVWASPGYDGDGSISIAIIDTGVDDSHADLNGRNAFWGDYTPDNEPLPRDVLHHGSHVAGIALGTGDALGTGTTLRFTQSGDLSPLGAEFFYTCPFDFPAVNTTWYSEAKYAEAGPTSLWHLSTINGNPSFDDPGVVFSGSLVSGAYDTSVYDHASVFSNDAAHGLYPAFLQNNDPISLYAVSHRLTNFPVVDGHNTLSGVAPECNWVGAKV